MVLEKRSAWAWGMRWPGRGYSNTGEQSRRRRRGLRVSGELKDLLPAPPPRLVRELRRVRIAALHRKGVGGAQRVCVCGCVTAGRGLRAATPYPSGGAGAEPRQGARPATVYWGPCARRPRASVPALLGSPPETGG